MRSAEIEEKDFEGALYNQLLSGHLHIATPGQVFEGKLGIDAALEVINPSFWKTINNNSYIPKGAVLDHYRWGFIWRQIGKNRKLPTFSVNLLVQAKRPDVLKGVNNKLTPFGIIGEYWRIKITLHQQVILEKVAKKLKARCLVTYASPAFDTFDDLYRHTENGTVVENTNFVKVSRLEGHQSWNYNSSGTSGVANIEPEKVSDISFDKQINNLDFGSTDMGFDEELFHLQSTVLNICEELSLSNGIAKYYVRQHKKLKENLNRAELPENSEVLLSYLSFYLFTELCGLTWLCVGETPDISATH
jgi:hypothetical protein